MAGNKYSWRRKLTLEKAEQIGSLLRTNAHMTISSAAAKVDLPPGLVNQTLFRYEHGTCPSELDEQCAAAIVAGLQDQFDTHRMAAEAAAIEGNATQVGWKRWRLETASPREHAKVTKQELSGPDEGPIEMSSMPFHQVLELASGNTSGEGGEDA